MFTAALIASTVTSANPWISQWDTPYGIPPFDELKVSLYVEAVKAGIQIEKKEIESIVADDASPTFSNTVVKYIRTGAELSQASRVFGCLFALEQNDEYEKARKEVIALMSRHSAEILSNKKLFDRIDAVFKGDKSNLTSEEKTILKRIHSSFRRGGVSLEKKQRDHLREINEKMSLLSMKFSKNILIANNAFKKDFGVDVANYYDVIAETDDRAKRKAMFSAYVSRGFHEGENDNRPVLIELLKLRKERATLLGYKSSADYFNEPRMASDAKTAYNFLLPIVKAAASKAKEEIVELKKLFDADIKKGVLPPSAKFEPWDLLYYLARYKKSKYSYSEEAIKPYFKSENVLKGVFKSAEWLYGIKAEKLNNLPCYHPGIVDTYKITDRDGSLVGIFIVDYSPRSTKSGGAWMNSFRKQKHSESGEDVRPIILNACNFGEYLSVSDVETAFHEFGHALHGLLSKCKYSTVSGTSGYSEYNEIFSQINERRAFHPKLLAEYAIDDKTSNVLPKEFADAIEAAKKCGMGILTSKLSLSALIDLKWHILDDADGVDVAEFEKRVAEEVGMPPEVFPRHRSAHFKHIFSGGYSAAYYTYIWAEVLDRHLFSVFEKSGDVWNEKLAEKFRKTFLEKGASEDPMMLFRSFTGANEPDPQPFFEDRGLTPVKRK
jgi:peptidyl-dipeptidase Dcp